MTIEHLDGDRVAISPEAMTDYMKAHNMKPMTKEIAETMMAEYDAGIRAGGEPHYPQEAADFLRSGMTNHQDKEPAVTDDDIVERAWQHLDHASGGMYQSSDRSHFFGNKQEIIDFARSILGHAVVSSRTAASPQLPVAEQQTTADQDMTPPELLASRLITAWCEAHGKRIPWDKAVKISAIVTKMPDEERDRLLSYGDDVEPSQGAK